MSDSFAISERPQRYTSKNYGIILAIALIAIAGIGAVFLFTQKELQRDLARWQDKLNLIADARADEVTEWVQNNFKGLAELADNASLQVYFAVAETGAPADATAPEAAQVSYLRNLLTATADRLQFQPSGDTLAQQLKANVQQHAQGGIALLDMNGKVIVATGNMPPVEGTLAQRIQEAPKGSQSLLDMERSATGTAQIGFVVPIYSVQGDRSAASQVGMIVGVKNVGPDFYAMMQQPSGNEGSLEISLVRIEADNVLYLTPLMDKSAAMTKRQGNDPTTLDAALAIAKPGAFIERKDYRGQDVLATGRAIAGTPWTLVTKLNRHEALAESNKWRATLSTIFLLVFLAMITGVIAVWRHAVSRQSVEMSQKAQALAFQADARSKLLTLVTDNQPEPLYIVDNDSRVWFANRKAAEIMGTTQNDVRGKSLASLIGGAFAKQIEEGCQKATQTRHIQMEKIERGEGDEMRTICARHVPLSHIPVEGLADPTPGVLVAEQDITDLMSEREKRITTMDQLIGMLVSLVDRRDPHAAQHSAYVAKLTAAVAEEMELDERTAHTAETAALLMNIGKIVVPAELLTRAASLNEQEKLTIRSSVSTSADMLDGITFDGPVVETLRQTQEWVDGSGPLHLKGEHILISAKIVSAANIVVGMLSPRSWRAPHTIEEATKELMGKIDTQFDQKVVVALINYIDNRGGRQMLTTLSHPERRKAS